MYAGPLSARAPGRIATATTPGPQTPLPRPVLTDDGVVWLAGRPGVDTVDLMAWTTDGRTTTVARGLP